MSDPVIPVVDLADVASSDPAARERASAALREAFGTYGLVYVTGHKVDRAGLRPFYDAFRSFVARSEAEKTQCLRASDWYQRGWTPANTEKAVAAGGQPDFKECFFAAPCPRDEENATLYPELYPENVWPEPAVPGFKDGYLALGSALHEAGVQLLAAAARALGLDDEAFTRRIAGGAHVTRVLDYLPLNAEQIAAGVLWGEEHTDFNLLTLLPGGQFYNPDGEPASRPDDRSGLYLRTRATAEHPRGVRVRGSVPEGCLVAQVGQQLEILTGGRFLATPHEITACGVPGWSRLSSAHFVHLAPNEVLFPLEPFRHAATITAYAPPVLAGTYDIKTLVDIGLAPRTALDKLGYRHYDRLDSFKAAERR
ncbi:MAG: isopenicillin N synthase family oxygenase [Deltaproteobacteria bacterium]|nr:isopenicillin N synthase family oxygenase [Deltaproteobacteria bacterium]